MSADMREDQKTYERNVTHNVNRYDRKASETMSEDTPDSLSERMSEDTLGSPDVRCLNQTLKDTQRHSRMSLSVFECP